MAPARLPKVILLDVEGTTTPIDFVAKVLFPFSSEHLDEFLSASRHRADVQAALDRSHEAWTAETDLASRPDWSVRGDMAGASAWLRRLIALDRKEPGLKAIQGFIWEEGYRQGTLRGDVFADVPGAFARWKNAGLRIAIYSSGSVLAQQLLFRHGVAGDLTPHIDAHFDTAVGGKRESASYSRIAQALQVDAGSVLFASDIEAELDAACEAGMRTVLMRRPGNAPTGNVRAHAEAKDFDAVP